MKSFRTRILLLVLGIVAVPLLATIYALSLKAETAAAAQAATELRAGAAVARETLSFRGDQLANAVRVLTADFGFKEAVASGDRDTLLSALENHGARIKANVVAAFDTNGKLLAAAPSELTADAENSLLEASTSARGKTVYRFINGTTYQLVSAMVRAPEPVASVVIGFALDATLAQAISQVVGVDVAFVSRDQAGREGIVSSSSLSPIDLLAELRTGSAQTNHMVAADTNKFLVQHEALPINAGSLMIVLHAPLNMAAQPYLELRQAILLFGGGALLIALIAGAWLARAATKPVTALTAAAERMQRGDYSPVSSDSDAQEFRQLTAAFTAMRTAVAEREQRILYQAHYDELTGLPNRSRIQELVAALATERESDQKPFSLCLLDIVHFSDINASLGHGVGDRLVRELAARMAATAPINASVARVGVDQFLILLPDCNLDAALLMCGDLLQQAQMDIEADDIPIRLAARCGLVGFPLHGKTAEELMRRVDIALFSAHRSGSATAVFEPEAELKHLRRIQVLGDLQRGIESNQLRLVFQPKMDLRTQAIDSCEALVRWRHPTHGEVPPSEFIPHAERTGSIRHLTSWILKTVVAQLAAWNAVGRHLEVAVNLSAADIVDPTLASELEGLIEQYRIRGEQLICEITEGVAMRNVDVALRAMDRLRELGVRFAIDDFGTGYSSLAQLSRLPVDELKLDGGLIKQLSGEERARTVVRAMVELGHSLNMRIVAEGVETAHLMRTAAKLGCDIAQGYLLSKPLSPEDLAAWLDKHNIRYAENQDPTLTTRMRAFTAAGG